jgi:hypothetical protein
MNSNKYQNHNDNSHNYDLNEKKLLIDYIYSNINISKFKYKLLENYSDLANFQESQKFYVSANFSGSNCLLVFCKLKGKFYSFMVDRKTLSFNSEQIKYESVNIIPVNIKLENSIYNGTIIDGIFIKHDKKKEKFFVITDLYMFRGVTTEKDKINMKLSNIETYLDYNMKSCQNLILTINKLYELENIDKLVNDDIKKTHDFHVRGLSFYPETSATKLIYVFNEDKDKKVLNKNNGSESSSRENREIILPSTNNNNQVSENKKTKIKYSIKSEFKNQEIIFVLELKKTEISDVYKLFAVEEFEKEDKKILRTKKMGIAYVPTRDISLKCKEIFNKNVNGRALFACKFDDNKNKWIPLDEVKNVKVPNKISEIEMKLELIEETDSESE